MKKVMSVVAVASVMAASTAFALTFNGTNEPKAGVVASKHNMMLYDKTAKDAEGRVCAYCHTPHHALDNSSNESVDYLPLWSHELTGMKTYRAYYTSTVGVAMDNPITGATALCMSCHDGVVAIDQHYGTPGNNQVLSDDQFFGGTAIGKASATSAGAGDLSNDHPMGFLWDDAATKHGSDLKAKTSTYASGTKTIEQQLTGGFFTCATCHDVHNKDNVANSYPGAQRNYFLLGDNNGSAFCLSCHVK